MTDLDDFNATLNAVIAATGRLRAAGVDVPYEITSRDEVTRIFRLDAALTFFGTELGAGALEVEFDDGTTVSRTDVGLDTVG